MPPARYAICVGLAVLVQERTTSAQTSGVTPRAKSAFQQQAASQEQAAFPKRAVCHEQIAQWVRDLDDDRYAVREAATAALSKAGHEAIHPLTKGAAGPSPEVSVRCLHILETMGGDDHLTLADAAREALESLAPPQQTRATERAAAALARIYAKEAVRAKKRLHALGAIHGSGENFIRKDVQRENHLMVTKKRWTGRIVDLRLFASVQDITYVSIHGVRLGADALPHLMRLQHVQSLELYGTGLDAKSVAQLRAALPNVGRLDVRSGGVLGVSRFGLTNCELREIMPDSPAEKVGLRAADVLSEIDGKPLENYRALLNYLATKNGGDKVTLKVQRGDKKLDIEVTLGSWGDD